MGGDEWNSVEGGEIAGAVLHWGAHRLLTFALFWMAESNCFLNVQ